MEEFLRQFIILPYTYVYNTYWSLKTIIAHVSICVMKTSLQIKSLYITYTMKMYLFSYKMKFVYLNFPFIYIKGFYEKNKNVSFFSLDLNVFSRNTILWRGHNLFVILRQRHTTTVIVEVHFLTKHSRIPTQLIIFRNNLNVNFVNHISNIYYIKPRSYRLKIDPSKSRFLNEKKR